MATPETTAAVETAPVSHDVLEGKWAELKALHETVDADLARAGRGTNSAVARVRKTLRAAKKVMSGLIKDSLLFEKAQRAERKAARAAKATKPAS